MIKRMKKFIAISLTALMISTSSIGVFAQDKELLKEESRQELIQDGELSNSVDLGVEDINEEIRELYPYGEIVDVQETEYGIAYYVDSGYHKTRKKRNVWDALDVVMAGASWADFFKDPSLSNLGWATLDTAALLPLLPSTAYMRKGGKIFLKTSEVKKFAKTSKGKTVVKKALKKSSAVCFVKGTKILTNEGYKNIEDIKIGDLVYSKDIVSGKENLKSVKNTFKKTTNKIININTNKTEIYTTEGHPFFVKDEGFKKAKDIKINDKIIVFGNGEVEVTSKKVKKLSKQIEVFNFEVDDYHNYFVGEEKLLVHNRCQLLVRESPSVKRAIKKLSPEAKKGYNKVIQGLTAGDLRGLNDHSLTGVWKGYRAVDIKGIGSGRGQGRAIYKKLKDGSIEIIEVTTKHEY